MRNVRFNEDVIKELRRLVRNSNLGNELRAALVTIYQTGYDQGLAESARQIRKVIDDNTSARASSNDNRVGDEPESSVIGTGSGADATDSDSGQGGTEFQRRAKVLNDQLIRGPGISF